MSKTFCAKKVNLLVVTLIATLMCGVVSTSEAMTLKVWTGIPEMIPVYKEAMKDFQKTHPGVKIDPMYFELREMERKCTVGLPSGTAGDIIEMWRMPMHRYIEKKLISPVPSKLVTIIKERGISEYFPPSLWKGTFYSVPFYRAPRYMFWNKEMFREAGLPLRAPKTWQELIGFSCKLAKYDSEGRLIRSGISLRLAGAGSGVTEKWWVFLVQAGGTILKQLPNGKWCAAYADEAGYETLKLYIDLLYKYRVNSTTIRADADAFVVGKTAMLERELFVAKLMKQRAPNVEYGIAWLPRYKKAGDIMAPFQWYVPETSKNKTVAWKFVEHLITNPKYLEEAFLVSGLEPILTKGLDYRKILNEYPQYKDVLKFPKDYELQRYPYIAPVDEIYTKLAARLVRAFRDESLLDNPKKMRKVLTEAAEETNSILKRENLYGEE